MRLNISMSLKMRKIKTNKVIVENEIERDFISFHTEMK